MGEWMRAFQLCSLKNKNSHFLKSACDVGLLVRVAVCGAETALLALFFFFTYFNLNYDFTHSQYKSRGLLQGCAEKTFHF